MVLSNTVDTRSVEDGVELRKDFTLIDNIYDSFCEGCQSQRVEERSKPLPVFICEVDISPVYTRTLNWFRRFKILSN